MRGLGIGWNKYSVGDTVEIHGIGNQHWTKGVIIYVLQLPGYSMEHYVVEIYTPVDPLLEIRTGCTLEMRMYVDATLATN